MTHYENERSLPVYTRPFAKRRMIRSTVAESVERYRHCNCELCKTVKAIEGRDYLEDHEVHGIMYQFKRKILDYSNEEPLEVTLADNLQYWRMVAAEIVSLNEQLKSH